MALVLAREALIENTFSREASPVEMRLLVKSAWSREFLLCSPLSKSDMRRNLALKGLNQFEKLVDAMASHMICAPHLEEKLLKKVSPDDLFTLNQSEAWDQALLKHRAPIDIGETRETAFGRIFGYLLKVGPSEVSIVDRFFAAKLLKSEEVVDWLLGQFLSRGASKVAIYSEAATEGNFATMAKPEQVALISNRLFDIAKTFDRKIEINLNMFEQSIHNRHLAIKFSEGEFVFEIGQGVDIFKLRGGLDAALEAQEVHLGNLTLKQLLNTRELKPSVYQLDELSRVSRNSVHVRIMGDESWK